METVLTEVLELHWFRACDYVRRPLTFFAARRPPPKSQENLA